MIFNGIHKQMEFYVHRVNPRAPNPCPAALSRSCCLVKPQLRPKLSLQLVDKPVPTEIAIK